MPRKPLRATFLCALSWLASGARTPKRHTTLALAGWLAGRTFRGNYYHAGIRS